jgi:hypothetical protein
MVSFKVWPLSPRERASSELWAGDEVSRKDINFGVSVNIGISDTFTYTFQLISLQIIMRNSAQYASWHLNF